MGVFVFAIILSTLSGYTSAFSFAGERSIFVVPTFDSKGFSSDDAEFVTGLFTSNLANLGFAEIVEKSSVDKKKKELSFKSSDCSNVNKVAELGRALNASHVATGELTKKGSNLTLTVSILDVKKATIIASHTESVKSIDAFFDKMPFFCDALISKAGGSKTFVSERQEIIREGDIPYGQYKIGDEGPGGGIVFYASKKGFKVYDGKGDAVLCHYLEMSYTAGWSYWFPERIEISDLKTGLGYGKANTHKILNFDMSKWLTDESCAAYRCNAHYTSTTKAGDWWLPSKDELELIYKNQKERLIAESTYKWIWSSSDDGFSYAWGKDLEDGQTTVRFTDEDESSNRGSVWAVRSF